MTDEGDTLSRRSWLKTAAGCAALALMSAPLSAQAPAMLKRPIPSSREPLPVVGVGTWQTFDVAADAPEREELREVLKLLVDAGGSVVDSSPMYGRSERVAGDLAAELKLRDRLFFATKVWTSGREAGIRQMESSLKLMRTQRMDLMQVHNLLDVSTHAKTLREWKDAGRIRYAGITHYHAGAYGELETLIRTKEWDFVQFNYSMAERAPLKEVLSLFVQLGGRVVDSSPMYGRSESVLGDLAVSLGVRDKLFVATKVWTSGRAAGIAQMQDSERKLRGKVDLMQVHNLLDVDTHLATLREWKRAGRVRHIGITHYTSGAYDDLARIIQRGGIDFVQLNYSLAERDAERRILPFAAERGVKVLINRPFGGGSLFRDVRGKPLPPFAKEIGCSSWAELFLKFVVSHPAVTCAIPATSKPEHLRQNMSAGRGPMPNAAMRARIAAAVG